MNNLPKDITIEILSYCDTIKDFKNWSMVSKLWNYIISGNKKLKSLYQSAREILGQYPSGLHFRYFNFNNNSNKDNKPNNIIISVPQDYIITGMYYVIDQPFVDNINNKIFNVKIGNHKITDPKVSAMEHPYYYGSSMLSNPQSGFLCVSVYDECNYVKIDISQYRIIIGYTFKRIQT